MKQKNSTRLKVGLLSAMTCPVGEASASEASRLTITIHLYNYAAVPDKMLARAKEEAGGIFTNAGLMALWRDHALSLADLRHPHQSTEFWDGTHFVLRLLRQARQQSSKNAMGEAVSAEIADVFVNRATEQAAVSELSVSRMLGHAIAHEIGHLLLGYNSHSPGGIMASPWSRQDLSRISKGNLRFTQQEVARIRAQVRLRSRLILDAAD